MTTSVSTDYRRLAIITAVFVYLLIVAGGVVRVTQSGLGCPDWPTCYGSLLPPTADRIVNHPQGYIILDQMGGDVGRSTLAANVEYTHRIIAMLGGLSLILTIGLAWLRYRSHRWISIPAAIIAGLMLVQVPLGGIVVLTELEPLLVGIHLGIALAIFACALAVAHYTIYINQDGSTISSSRTTRNRLLAALIALFTVLMVGAGVVGSNTGLSCPDWPLCNVNRGVIIVPPANFSPRVWYHLLHRYTVAAFSIMVVWVFIQTLRQQKHIRGIVVWNYALLGLFTTQIAIGALQVLLHKPPFLRALHVAVASGAWAALCMMLLLNYLGYQRSSTVD